MQNPEWDFTFYQFVDFFNFDMFTIHIFRNCYVRNLTQVVTTGVNEIYFFVLFVSHWSIFQIYRIVSNKRPGGVAIFQKGDSGAFIRDNTVYLKWWNISAY